MHSATLPNLLYLANVPVECSYHGSALMYRLLQNYPPEKLCIIESLNRSLENRRLPGVKYINFPTCIERATRTRFAALYSSLSFLRASSWTRRVRQAISPFQPDAVLSVSHGHLWVTAAAFAQALQIPLHLVCHDEITKTVMHQPWLRSRLLRVFGDVYHGADSRLCVSPYMRNDYRARFGVDAEVLYPSRAIDAPRFETPSEHLTDLPQGLRVAFAGTINMGGHVALLKSMALSLEGLSGKLLLFGPLSKEAVAQLGLDASNIEIRGLLPSNELIHTLRTEADILYAPMSFDPEDHLAMKTNFPSKLTDYTAVGLPILIQGPPDSSAVSWARENAEVAAVVTTEASVVLLGELERLRTDSAYRINLASRALVVGNQYFDATAASQIFHRVLARPAMR